MSLETLKNRQKRSPNQSVKTIRAYAVTESDWYYAVRQRYEHSLFYASIASLKSQLNTIH